MGEVTYNCGRVVGWSAYEDFLKEHQLSPSVFPKAAFVRMLEFGMTSRVILSLRGWETTEANPNVYQKIVKVPGAVYGSTPVCGIDYTAYRGEGADNLELLRQAVDNIFTFYVSDSEGVPTEYASEDGSREGYLTFLAYKELFENEILQANLLIKGLGIQSFLDQSEVFSQHYTGPQGILDFSVSTDEFWKMTYSRTIGDETTVIDLKSQPIIDLKSSNGDIFYDSSDSLIDVDVTALNVTEDTASVLTVYQKDPDFPPAAFVYQSTVSSGSFSTEAWPLDTVAPGTVKLVVGDDENMAKAEAGAWKAAYPGIWTFYRVSDDQVLREVVDISNDSVNSLPVAEVSNSNLGGLHWYARKCFRFTADGPAGGAGASNTMLQNVDTVTCLATLSGQVNQEFIDRFAVEMSDIYDTTSSPLTGKFGLTIDTPTTENNVMFQIVNQIPREEWSRYYAILIGISSTAGDAIQRPDAYTLFIPILKNERLIEYSTSVNHRLREHLTDTSAISLDFSYEAHEAAMTAGKQDRWLLMGTWWAGNVIDGEVTKTISDFQVQGHDVAYIDEHPAYQSYQRDNGLTGKEFIYMPEHATPKPPKVQYGTNWPRWFDDVKMSEFFTTSEMSSSPILSEYWNMSVNKFCESICIRGLGEAATKDNRATPQIDPFMLYSKSTILDFASRTVGNGVSLNSDDNKYYWTEYMKSEIQMRPIAKSKSFFAPAFVHFYPITWNSEERPRYVVNFNNELFFDDSQNAIWASQTQTGERTSLSLSLADEDGGALPLDGTSGTADVDTLSWKYLLEALNSNESLDILGKNLLLLKANQFQSISLKFNPITSSTVYSTSTDPFYQNLTIEMLGISGRNTDNAGISAIMNLTPATTGNPPVISGTDSWYQVFQLTADCLTDLKSLVNLTGAGNASGYSTNMDIMIIGNPATIVESNRPTARCLNTILYISLTESSENDDSYGRAILYVKNNGEEVAAGQLSISGIVVPVYQETALSDRYQETTTHAAGIWTGGGSSVTGSIKIYSCTKSGDDYIIDDSSFEEKTSLDAMITWLDSQPAANRYYVKSELGVPAGTSNAWIHSFGSASSAIKNKIAILEMNEGVGVLDSRCLQTMQSLWKLVLPTSLTRIAPSTFSYNGQPELKYIWLRGSRQNMIGSTMPYDWGISWTVDTQWDYSGDLV